METVAMQNAEDKATQVTEALKRAGLGEQAQQMELLKRSMENCTNKVIVEEVPAAKLMEDAEDAEKEKKRLKAEAEEAHAAMEAALAAAQEAKEESKEEEKEMQKKLARMEARAMELEGEERKKAQE